MRDPAFAGKSALPAIVGYVTTQKVDSDFCTFIGASFQDVANGSCIPFSSLSCVEGFEDGDQIQKAYVDGNGLVGFTVYEYWDGDGWVDPTSGDVVGDTAGLSVGEAAWFLSSTAKQITTAGAVIDAAKKYSDFSAEI